MTQPVVNSQLWGPGLSWCSGGFSELKIVNLLLAASRVWSDLWELSLVSRLLGFGRHLTTGWV